LIDKEKMIRDQANKTLEIFMQRVRKYALTLPETVQQPASSTAANMPRMGAPAAGESSWTGWAISSFTNKLASVNGEISTTNNGSSTLNANEPRTQSLPSTAVPSPTNTPALSRPVPSTTMSMSSMAPPTTIKKSSPSPNPFSGASTPTQPAEPEDFDSNWGNNNDTWGTDDDPFAQKGNETSEETGGSGEPDFSAWLSSQSKTSKKALPKGLTKSGTGTAQAKTVVRPKPAIAAATSVPKKVVTTAKPAIAKKVIKKEPEKPAEDDAWGDDW
jgi:SCY1-like protein 1